MILVAKVINTHGLKGDIKIISYTDNPDRFKVGNILFDSEQRNLTIENHKIHGKTQLLKLKEINTIDDAIKLKDQNLYIEEDEIMITADDTYFIHDLIGLSAYIDGNYVGELVDVLEYSSNDVYVIENEGKQLLVAALKQFVLDIDLNKKSILLSRDVL